ncbi:GcrA family cell cycle regulator [Glacieibacterium sp.]|uniref:GcrA family cell cycle regulator n=1 Tax=Glacieibacterium sp. TaxID=2860237 RepID=UPI003B0010CF
MSWTDARIELLRTSWESGLTASQIAEVLGEGVSRNAVIGKAHRLGLKSRPSPVRAGGEATIAAVLEESVAEPAAAPVAEATAPVEPVAARPAPVPPVRKIVRPAPPAKPAKTTLLDLSEKVCKWPIGHPGEPDFHFCGKPSQASFPYCTEHCAIAYQAQLPRRDRNRAPPPVMPGFAPRR